jgi:hypothetical protein
VAEWSIATVLKTVGLQGPVSSNLTASARLQASMRPSVVLFRDTHQKTHHSKCLPLHGSTLNLPVIDRYLGDAKPWCAYTLGAWHRICREDCTHNSSVGSA